MQTKKIMLSISLLASRNSKEVRRCLDSLEPIRRAIPCEVIAVDTSGGDEQLRQVLSECADEIVSFTWCDDFSKARNAGLERAKGEWFLYIDDDEWFVETEHIIQFFKKGDYRKYNGANYIVRNFVDAEGTQWMDAWVSRMVRIQPGTHFVSPIHEYISPAADRIVALKSIVYHFGYVYETQEDLKKHFNRNSRLLQKMIEQEPDNLRWRQQMLMEYVSVSEWESLYDFAEECMECIREKGGKEENRAWGAYYAAKIIALEGENNYEQAHRMCEEALKDPRINQLAQAFMYFRKGRYEIRLGRYEQAEKDIHEYLGWKQYFEKHDVVLQNQRKTPFVCSVFEIQQLQQAYAVLICAGLKQKKLAYLKKYWEKLGYEKEHVNVYSLLPECLIEAMATMPEDPIFISVLQVVAQKDALWIIFRLGFLKWVMEEREGSLQLIALLQKAGINDSFLQVYHLRYQVCNFPEEETNENLQKMLGKYVESAEAYFRDSYAEELEVGQIEELPPDYRAVLLLKELFSKTQLEEKLALVKPVVEAYPPLGNTMKRYIRVLQQTDAAKADRQNNMQLQLMAEQIMKQVPILLEARQTAEALEVVKQLRAMLPEDERVRELEEQIKLQLS